MTQRKSSTALPPHGVREALIRAGIDLLDETGGQGLTLRGAAARAGVSHAAPAYHFDGLPGLRQAIAIRGFQMFLDRLQTARATPHSDPFEALLAINRVYIGFATDHAKLFRIMFVQSDHADPRLQQIAGRCYDELRHACRMGTDSNDPIRETAVWALTHGYAVLGMARARPNAPAAAPDYRALLRLLVPETPPADSGCDSVPQPPSGDSRG